MISRRNIRVKVMQTLYITATSDNVLKSDEPQKVLQAYFNQTQELLVYLIYFIAEVCRYSETYAHRRAGMHITTFEDLNINTKISGNKTLWKILEDNTLKEVQSRTKPHLITDKEIIKKTYLSLAETAEYKTYINKVERDNKEEKEILEFILDKLMLANENFTSHIEDLFPNWEDDGEMIILILVSYLQKPGHTNFKEIITADKKDFAKRLLETVGEKKEHLQSLIVPKLKNWDPERIALIDMILMEMGVSEFLYFETIPPKVTINEYIDLAKDYSTLQSGQFVNGILDNIHKELVQNGTMQKVDYKKT